MRLLPFPHLFFETLSHSLIKLFSLLLFFLHILASLIHCKTHYNSDDNYHVWAGKP